ncbi:MAG: hypothetical protein HPZ79_00930 [Oscillospiraceae bacterium]|nr:hypothetical protein [Oscillospiraceae bacterium]
MKWKLAISRDEAIDRLKQTFIGDFDSFQVRLKDLPHGTYGAVEQVGDDVTFALYVSIARTWAVRCPLAHIGGSLTSDVGCTILSAHYLYSVWAYVVMAFLGLVAIVNLLHNGIFLYAAFLGICIFAMEMANVKQKEALEKALHDIFQDDILSGFPDV